MRLQSKPGRVATSGGLGGSEAARGRSLDSAVASERRRGGHQSFPVGRVL